MSESVVVKGPGRPKTVGLLVVVVCVLAIAWTLGPGRSGDADTGSGEPTFAVREGPMTVSVTESGTIKPRDVVIIKNETEGNPTILYLIPEGTRVEAGDLLVELDVSSLEDRKIDLEIDVENAEAAFIQGRENLAVVSNKAASDLDIALRDLVFSKEDLVHYLQGEYPNALREQQGRLTLAEEDARRAQETLKWSQVLFDNKYIAESELQADVLAVKKAALDVELATNSLALLQKFTYTRRVAELESDIKQNTMAMERTHRKAAADIVQAEVNLRAKDLQFRRESAKLEKLKSQIAKAIIKAPRAGLVVYESSTRASWRRSSSEPLAEGQTVRERQELIHLPTASNFMVEVKLHETNLDKVSVGLPVRIRLGALPGQMFSGKVATIAPLADPQSSWGNPNLKVYSTEIHIDGNSDELRTGMSCEAEILIDHFASTRFVPVQCVVRIDGETTVFSVDGDVITPRRVDIGLDNGRMVQILKGVEVDEFVSLAPPLAEGAVTDPEALSAQDSERLQSAHTARPAQSPQAPKAAGDKSTRDAMREKMKSMTPEQRKAYMKARTSGSGRDG